jgi:hypothetical protein
MTHLTRTMNPRPENSKSRPQRTPPSRFALPRKTVKVLILFICHIVWMATITASGWAYFCVALENKPIKAIIPRTDVMPTLSSHLLVLSDNDEFHSHFNSSVDASLQELRRYVFAGYLPITEIVTRQSDRYMSSDFSIENLLYANLKIERLMNEYERLKDRSASVLEGLDVPYIYESREFESMLGQKDVGITHQIDRVSDQSNLIAGPAQFVFRQKEPADGKYTKRSIQVYTSTQRRLNFEKPTISYSNGGSLGSSSASNQAGNGSAGSAPDPASSVKNVQYGNSAGDQLPWLIRATRSLRHYIYENKIESIFYFLMIFVVIQIVFSSRR